MTDDDGFDEEPTPQPPVPAQRRPTNSERLKHRETYPRGTPIVMGDDERALAGRRYRPQQPVDYSDDGETTGPRELFDMQAPGYSEAVAALASELRRSGVDPYVAHAALAIKLTDHRRRGDTERRELDAKLKAYLDVQPGQAKFTELEGRVEDTDNALTVIANRIDQLGNQLAEINRRLATMERHLEGDGSERRPGLLAIVDDHADVIKPTRRLVRWVAGGAVTALLFVCGFLYKRGADEQAARDEIADLRRQIVEIKHKGTEP